MASQNSNMEQLENSKTTRKRRRTDDSDGHYATSPTTLSRTSTLATTSFESYKSSSTGLTWSSRSSTSTTFHTSTSTTSSFSFRSNESKSSLDDGDRFDSAHPTSGLDASLGSFDPKRRNHSCEFASDAVAPGVHQAVASNHDADESDGGDKGRATNLTARKTSAFSAARISKSVDSVDLYSSLLLLSSWSIRILRLSPATSYQARLEGSLFVAKLDEPLEYEALSYTWGQPFHGSTIPDSAIEIRSHRFSIAGNLDSALRQLRHTNRARDLWIDALCINQLDDKERGYQIEIMEHIYSRASCVLVWLGDDSPVEDGEYIFSFCRIIKRYGARPPRKAIMAHQSRWPNFKILAALFAKRNYFRRRWIVQEICHASNVVVMCGAWSVPLSTFSAIIQKIPASRRALEHIKDLCTTLGHLRQALHDWRLEDIRGSQVSTLSDFFWILQKFHNFDCLDPRDRLYALSSLWKGDVATPASVMNSGYSITCDKLYTEFAGNMIKNHLPDTRILCRLLSIAADQACRVGPPDNDSTLPTWVVDWRLDPAPRIGAIDVSGDIHVNDVLKAPYSALALKTRCYGEIVEADGHYRDWVIKSSRGLLMPSYHGSMPDEDYTAALSGLCSKIQAGDILCQPISTYRARNRHVADAAIVLRPTGKSPGSFHIVGRCPLDLWWLEAQGEDRESESICTESLTVLIQ